MSAVKSKAVAISSSSAHVTQPMELSVLLTPVMQGAMLTKQNVLLVSKPGYGKSEILAAMGNQVFGPAAMDGEDHTFVLPCTPSTLPADVVGYSNPMYAIDPEAAAKGMPEWITQGTPVNEEIFYCVLEEATRIGELGGDTLVHAMHNISKFHRPMYVANANWLTPTPRNEALRDRFSFTIFYQPSIVDVEGLVNTPAIDTWQFDLPTFDQIEQVRAWTSEYVRNPSDYECNRHIITLLKNIQRLCEGTGYEFNNRRVFQLRSLIYAMGCYGAQANDFTQLTRATYDALMYAYPVTSFQEAAGWKKIILSLVDRIETEIAEFKANAYNAWKNLYAEHAERGGQISAQKRDSMNRKLAETWQNYESELVTAYGKDDGRVKAALGEMFSIYAELIKGKNPLA